MAWTDVTGIRRGRSTGGAVGDRYSLIAYGVGRLVSGRSRYGGSRYGHGEYVDHEIPTHVGRYAESFHGRGARYGG